VQGTTAVFWFTADGSSFQDRGGELGKFRQFSGVEGGFKLAALSGRDPSQKKIAHEEDQNTATSRTLIEIWDLKKESRPRRFDYGFVVGDGERGNDS